ncbi:ABC transporter permease [Microtetraspora fusca]|uniref:ABC transporter permease n=1 Tax=Microtetraspora fusca TaxID=1997 RepID=A0ABW6V7Y5_MICFU|nr:ABC transporter permease [Microtetraspora fusca]
MLSTYLSFEIRRMARSGRFLIFALGLPIGLYLLESNVVGGTRDVDLYLMGGLAAFGAFKAAIDVGARTAVERGMGWQRQLRLTPLSGGGYLTAKGAVAMLVALPPVAGVALAAALASGITLSPGGWLLTVLGVWLGTLPFALLGLVIGQFATPQNLAAYQGGVVLLLSFLGGLFIPVTEFPGVLATVAKALPTYWLGLIGRAETLNGDVTGAAAVLAVYTLVLGTAVVLRYQQDAARAR